MTSGLSVVVLTKNEEKQIETCLKSLSFADEIIVIDSGSKDKTLSLVKKYTQQIYETFFTNFSDLRNLGKEKARYEWLLYIDADEEVPKELAKEILNMIQTTESVSAYFLRRRNFYLGREWKVSDRVERLFKKDKLKNWFGKVHESPNVDGIKDELKNELIHRTHNSLEEMLTNTVVWSDFEAKARFEAHHPPITWWRIFRMMLTSFWDYYVKQKGWTLGTVGLIESIYQSFSTFVTYAKLWELQNNPSLSSSRKRGSIR